MRIARLVPTAALAALLPALFLASAVHAADPNQVPPPPAMAARAYLLVDHNSGRVLASLNENQKLDPASITKLRTAYAVFRSATDILNRESGIPIKVAPFTGLVICPSSMR